jgi:hypothetical protein
MWGLHNPKSHDTMPWYLDPGISKRKPATYPDLNFYLTKEPKVLQVIEIRDSESIYIEYMGHPKLADGPVVSPESIVAAKAVKTEVAEKRSKTLDTKTEKTVVEHPDKYWYQISRLGSNSSFPELLLDLFVKNGRHPVVGNESEEVSEVRAKLSIEPIGEDLQVHGYYLQLEIETVKMRVKLLDPRDTLAVQVYTRELRSSEKKSVSIFQEYGLPHLKKIRNELFEDIVMGGMT